MYNRFELTKRSGKSRIIHAPNKRLKILQQRISLLISDLYRVRYPVRGFVKQKSVKTNALAHLGKRYLVNLDLKDFFGSISERRVAGVLRALGVDERVSEIIGAICCLDGKLPQGAPTSPIISNIICFRLDRELLAFAKGAFSIYTRYADDITFSCHRPPSKLFKAGVPAAGAVAVDTLSPDLLSTIAANGFEINPDKIFFADARARKTVTGLKVNDVVNVQRGYVRNIRAALYSVEVLGDSGAQEKFENQYGGKTSVALHLAGKLSWLRFVRGQSDPVFRALALRYNACFPDCKIKIKPTRDEIRDRAVWVVEHDKNQGTAFFLEGVGLVTAAHCVEGASIVDVFHSSRTAMRFEARVVRYNKALDLALLEHSVPQVAYYELKRSTRAIAVGDFVTALGYPAFFRGDTINAREGKVASFVERLGARLIEVTQKLAQGMSGGPVIDSDDGVVGVIHKGGPGEGRDYAINLIMLIVWLRS